MCVLPCVRPCTYRYLVTEITVGTRTVYVRASRTRGTFSILPSRVFQHAPDWWSLYNSPSHRSTRTATDCSVITSAIIFTFFSLNDFCNQIYFIVFRYPSARLRRLKPTESDDLPCTAAAACFLGLLVSGKRSSARWMHSVCQVYRQTVLYFKRYTGHYDVNGTLCQSPSKPVRPSCWSVGRALHLDAL